MELNITPGKQQEMFMHWNTSWTFIRDIPEPLDTFDSQTSMPGTDSDRHEIK